MFKKWLYLNNYARIYNICLVYITNKLNSYDVIHTKNTAF